MQMMFDYWLLLIFSVNVYKCQMEKYVQMRFEYLKSTVDGQNLGEQVLDQIGGC